MKYTLTILAATVFGFAVLAAVWLGRALPAEPQMPIDGSLPPSIAPTPPSPTTPKAPSVSLPPGWEVRNPAASSARLTAETGDWKVRWVGLETSGGVHIETGAQIEIFAFQRDIGRAPTPLSMPTVLEKAEEISGDGYRAALQTYRENNSSGENEGLQLEAKIERNGAYYTFRISFNPVTYPQGRETLLDVIASAKYQ